jgi:hypothetical protein
MCAPHAMPFPAHRTPRDFKETESPPPAIARRAARRRRNAFALDGRVTHGRATEDGPSAPGTARRRMALANRRRIGARTRDDDCASQREEDLEAEDATRSRVTRRRVVRARRLCT